MTFKLKKIKKELDIFLEILNKPIKNNINANPLIFKTSNVINGLKTMEFTEKGSENVLTFWDIMDQPETVVELGLLKR